jgi:hypothetical protein
VKKKTKIVTGLMGAALLVSVVPAKADAAPSSCATNYACIYWNSSFGGTQLSKNASASSIGNMSDQGSSLGNTRDFRSKFFQNTSWGGWDVCVSKQSSQSSLASDRNDEISSISIQQSQYC